MYRFKKTLRVVIPSVFFVLIFMLLAMATAFLAPRVYAAQCVPPGKSEMVVVTQVYDGDTLRLRDGRRVRLLGINTPELGRGNKPDEPFARQAKQAVEDFLAGESHVFLYTETETQDRYGRHLAYLFKRAPSEFKRAPSGFKRVPSGFKKAQEGFKDASNRANLSLGKTLLTSGLAYHVAIPPNLHLAACFAEAEKKAQRFKRGLWGPGGIAPVEVKTVSKGGYQRIRGKVSRVTLKGAWWINFGDGFTAVIYPEHQRYFDAEVVQGWQGSRLEVEGWVYRSRYKGKPQWRVKLGTPYSVTDISHKGMSKNALFSR